MSEAAPPRLAPVPPDQWDDDVRTALATAFSDTAAARMMSTGPDAMPVPNVLSTLMHHPALAGPFLVYNNVLLRTPTLDHRTRELIILRVAWRTRARYEWAQHVRIATGVGITPNEIAAIADAPEPGEWTTLEAAVLAAVDQCIDHYRVEDETWGRLAEQLDERQLVELVFVIGTYTGLAMAFNSFGLQLDADLQEIATTAFPEFEE